MLGLNVAPGGCSLLLSLLTTEFCPVADHRSSNLPTDILSKPTARSGLSLPRSDCPFPSHLYGIDVPDLPLHCLPD
jgi:hypothetical protein